MAMIRGCGCRFMQRTRGEAGSEAGVELEKAVRRHAWFHRKPGSSRVNENCPLPAAVAAEISVASWSKRKQSGKSIARCRLARKPKLRMRTKPRGSRCRRKPRRNSSTGRVMSRFLLP
jgi:hypothetical protein